MIRSKILTETVETENTDEMIGTSEEPNKGLLRSSWASTSSRKVC